MDADVRNVSADMLAQQCAESSLRSARHSSPGVTPVDQFCFELVRRAFAQQDGYSLGLVLDLYKRIWSRRWIRDPQAFDTDSQTVDDFTSVSFANVYRLYHGERFESFASFGAFLAYLHRALVRELARHLRAASTRYTQVLGAADTSELDPIDKLPAAENVQQDIERRLLWQAVEDRIADLISDPKERLIFDDWARQELGRAEIAADVNARWPDAHFSENDVRVALQRIRRRLLKDPILRKRLQDFRGGSDESGLDKN